jgi:hypothetical protein
MNKMLVVAGLFLAVLVPSAFAGSQRTQATVVLCVELHGNADTRFDVKRRPGNKCVAGEDKVTLPRGLKDSRVLGPAGAQDPAGTGPVGGGVAGATGPQARRSGARRNWPKGAGWTQRSVWSHSRRRLQASGNWVNSPGRFSSSRKTTGRRSFVYEVPTSGAQLRHCGLTCSGGVLTAQLRYPFVRAACSLQRDVSRAAHIRDARPFFPARWRCRGAGGVTDGWGVHYDATRASDRSPVRGGDIGNITGG